MTWSICWISRRIQHSGVLMISSTFQRLLWRTCGLFDNGFAGDGDFLTSPALNASTSTNTQSGFGLVDQSAFQQPAEPGLKATGDSLKPVNSWNVLDDFDDLSDDPLGDDSMEAFINLEKFLDGNSLFDDDGNLTITDHDNDFCVPNIETEAEVKPVIDFAPAPTSEVSLLPQFHMMEETPTMPQPTKTVTRTPAKRKRATRSKEGVKTSLFEISADLVTLEDKGSSSSSSLVVDSELDHDYSSKRQRMSSLSGSASSSGTKKVYAGYEVTLPGPSTVKVEEAECMLDESMDKQTIRRIKNNHASKRSREQRKQKFVEMDMEAEELIAKNKKLREKIVELEKLAKEMKEVLVAKMAGTG